MNAAPADPVNAGKDLVLVFTDMESSSRRWESEGGKFYSILQAHMDLLQEACRNNGGQAVKSTGDGFFMVFDRPEQAIRFALMAQIEFSNRPELPGARIGIDFGEVFEVQESGQYRDYVGSAANRAARICALAAPRTVILSEKIALTTDVLPFGARLESIGNHSLRNIGLERLYLLRHECLSDEQPQAGVPAPILPWSGDLFVGREAALEGILSALLTGDNRCVSIVGFGGMGKTRLSLEAARRLAGNMPDGVAFAELDGIRDPDIAWSLLAGALRTIGYEGDPRPQDVGAFLMNKRALVILDGVEGLPHAPEVVAALLSRTRNLKLLVTSRSRLKIPAVFILLEALTPEDAETLMRDRMQSQEPNIDFAGDAAAVAELCMRLDYIPLSIELAAARASLLTPREMLDRFEQRFAWMTDPQAPQSGHRRSLEATIAWSYELLSSSGQAALMAASLFSTGFRLDAWDRLMGSASLDALAELQRSSLIAVEMRADQPGKVFFLLETIRHFAAARLRADPQLRPDLVSKFAGNVLEQANRAISLCRTPAEPAGLATLDAVSANLYTALEHLVDLGSSHQTAAVCEVLAAFNHLCGRNRQAREIAAKGLAFGNEESGLTRAGLLRWHAAASLDLGDAPGCAQSAFRLLALAESLPSDQRERELCRAHNLAALAFTSSVEPASAAKGFEAALSIAVQIGDPSLEGMVRHNMGWLAHCHGELADAAHHLEAARVLRERLGDLRGIAETSSNMGLLEQARHNVPAALALHFRSLVCWATVMDAEGVGKALFNLAESWESSGRPDAGVAYYAGSLVMFERSESQYVDMPAKHLERLGAPESVYGMLCSLEPVEIIGWLRSRFGDGS